MSSLTPIDEGIWARPGTSGQTLALVGGMHGDEGEGAAVIEALVEDPSPLAACPHHVLLVLGNPEALALGTRHTPDGEDLNRLFGAEPSLGDSPEARRARTLRSRLAGVDRLLDIHTTQRPIRPLAVCSNSPDHLAALARLGLSQAVVGAERIYGRTMLADWIDARGGVGLTVEAGQSGTQEAAHTAHAVAMAFLADGAPGITAQAGGGSTQVFQIEAPLPCPGPGLRFVRDLPNGAHIKRGELLGHSEAGALRAPRDAIVFLAREHAEVGAPCMLLATAR
jgi:predicted deacylase